LCTYIEGVGLYEFVRTKYTKIITLRIIATFRRGKLHPSSILKMEAADNRSQGK
jgi:hypothetical protein